MKGYASKAGFVHSGDWEASFEQATTLIPLLTQSMPQTFVELGTEVLQGTAATRERQDGTELVKGDLATELDYNNVGLLRYGFGTQSTGTFDIADSFAGVTCHLEVELGGSKRLRYCNLMVDKLAMAGEFGKPVRVNYSTVSKSRTTSDTAFPSLALTSPQRVYMEHVRDANGKFWIGDLGDALSSSDAVPISGFEFTIDNGLRLEDVDTDSGYIVQPLRGGFRKVQFKIKLNRLNSTTASFLGWKASGTRLQAVLAFAKGAESVTLYLPVIKIVDGGEWALQGPGPLESEVTFDCYYNGPVSTRINANTGFAFTNEARLVIA